MTDLHFLLMKGVANFAPHENFALRVQGRKQLDNLRLDLVRHIMLIQVLCLCVADQHHRKFDNTYIVQFYLRLLEHQSSDELW